MMAPKHKPEYYKTPFFKWRQRVGFGISDYACNLAYLLTNTYLMFYYTNCAGISPGDAGFMFVVTKAIDAVTDYLTGVWIDRTDTKMGRYRPWMLFGAPVLAIGMIILFSVPTGWAYGAKLAWLRHLLLRLHSGEHPHDSHRHQSVSGPRRADQHRYHQTDVRKSWFSDLLSVRSAHGAVLLRQ